MGGNPALRPGAGADRGTRFSIRFRESDAARVVALQ
jgi:hypothetical protein